MPDPEQDSSEATPAFVVPQLPYLPCDPQRYRPAIGLVGCGGITRYHLQAYLAADYRVTALCDIDRAAAESRRDEFYPAAAVVTDYRELLADDRIEVVDVTTHPEVRTPIVADALRAGKHVLSQKPFVLDLDEGERLAELADQQGVRLAVNQNGRWAPHFSWLREAATAGAVGEVAAVHCGVHWDHSWVKGTAFEKVYHLMLYDFAIHWFDFLATIMGDCKPLRVYASTTRTPMQDIMPALMAQVAVEYPHAQATLVFDGHNQFGDLDEVFITGAEGALRSFGPDINNQTVELTNAHGILRPHLQGSWFPDGFHGTMGELLCALEEDRLPRHHARDNLRSLELCFAAVASALRNEPVTPGTVRRLPPPPA